MLRHDLARTRAAEFSECETYRYRLRYVIGDGDVFAHPVRPLVFVMLNPSTATELKPDPTITRCLGFARAWGFSDLLVANLFALRATDPAALAKHPDPVGPENDAVLADLPREAMIVAAWGAHPMAHDRSRVVHEAIQRPMLCLGMTAKGAPRHPLYVPAKTCPQPWAATAGGKD